MRRHIAGVLNRHSTTMNKSCSFKLGLHTTFVCNLNVEGKKSFFAQLQLEAKAPLWAVPGAPQHRATHPAGRGKPAHADGGKHCEPMDHQLQPPPQTQRHAADPLSYKQVCYIFTQTWNKPNTLQSSTWSQWGAEGSGDQLWALASKMQILHIKSLQKAVAWKP